MVIDTAEYIKKLTAALIKVGATAPCMRCGKTAFHILHGFFNHTVHERFDETSDNRSGVITAVLICKNCGWVIEHALQFLGLGDLKPDAQKTEGGDNVS